MSRRHARSSNDQKMKGFGEVRIAYRHGLLTIQRILILLIAENGPVLLGLSV